MSRNFGIVNMVGILFLAALLIGYMIYVQKERDELEQLKLSYSIDYSSDAAAMAMLKTGSLDMDYTKRTAFAVDPRLALDAFLDVFCFNYDMLPTEENKALIKDYIPVAAVAGYDGFYLASQQLVANRGGNYPDVMTTPQDADWDLVFGMKIPYTYKTSTASYALNMGLDDTLVLTGSSLSKQSGLPPGMSAADAKARINDIISSDMAYRINETNKANPNWQNAFYIPSQLTTFSGVNPIEGPGFLVLVQGVTLTTSRPISGFSVAGSKIDQARKVVGYTRNNIKFYAYSDKAPPSKETDPVNGIVYDELFDSMNEAASSGYYFDMEYMNK